MARADLHTHTRRSPDGSTSPVAFVRRCLARGLTHVAVTDHNTITGAHAIAAQAAGRMTVITGEEVSTTAGEIIGLFLDQRVPPGLSLFETVERIHVQGGLVMAPHPFDPLRPGIRRAGLRAIGNAVDIIEGYNGRALLGRFDRAARRWAEEHDRPVGLGSDAHVEAELGRSMMDLPDFDGPDELLVALREARYSLAPPAFWLLPLSGVALARHWSARVARSALPRAETKP